MYSTACAVLGVLYIWRGECPLETPRVRHNPLRRAGRRGDTVTSADVGAGEERPGGHLSQPL